MQQFFYASLAIGTIITTIMSIILVAIVIRKNFTPTRNRRIDRLREQQERDFNDLLQMIHKTNAKFDEYKTSLLNKTWPKENELMVFVTDKLESMQEQINESKD